MWPAVHPCLSFERVSVQSFESQNLPELPLQLCCVSAYSIHPLLQAQYEAQRDLASALVGRVKDSTLAFKACGSALTWRKLIATGSVPHTSTRWPEPLFPKFFFIA